MISEEFFEKGIRSDIEDNPKDENCSTNSQSERRFGASRVDQHFPCKKERIRAEIYLEGEAESNEEDESQERRHQIGESEQEKDPTSKCEHQAFDHLSVVDLTQPISEQATDKCEQWFLPSGSRLWGTHWNWCLRHNAKQGVTHD
jgi:hypothetical protein